MRPIGCYNSELSFSQDKIYSGGSAGSRLSGAKDFALSSNKKYFGISSNIVDGHIFAFNRLTKRPDYDSPNEDCDRPCSDDSKFKCGCADQSCRSQIPDGEDNNRRWFVYEIIKKKK